MDKSVLKEITKLSYLNKYERGKTLLENRTLLVENILTNIFGKIFRKQVGGKVLKSGISTAEKMTLKNIDKYVTEEFAETLNERIVKAQEELGFPLFTKGVGKSADIDISPLLSMLQRVLRDGGSQALNTFERNILHTALATIDDDFFKTLQKSLKETDEIITLLDGSVSNRLKRKILNDPVSIKGISDEILEKMGIPVSVIRKTTTEVIEKGSKEALKKINKSVVAVLTNAVRRFSKINLSKRIKFNPTQAFGMVMDTFVTATMIPIWLKMTVFKILTFRLITKGAKGLLSKMFKGKFDVFSKKTLSQETGLATLKGETQDKFMQGGLFGDIVTLVAKEGSEKVGAGKYIFNLPSALSRGLLGSRAFNYTITGLVWFGYMISNTKFGEYYDDTKNAILGIFRGGTLGPCSQLALTGKLADMFAPENDPGMLNKLGIEYDLKAIKGDAIELYAALSPQCFTSEADFKKADITIKEWLNNSPSRLYMSLVSREYKKLTGGGLGFKGILPQWEEYCRQPLFAKASLYEDILQFEKHEDWGRDVFTFEMEMERLPLGDYARNLCNKPLIDKDFDQLVIEVNNYLWEPDAEVPDFIKRASEKISESDFEEIANSMIEESEILGDIKQEFDELKTALTLEGFDMDEVGNIELQIRDAIKLKIALQNAPGMDQLVYIGEDGFFTTRASETAPMKMNLKTWPYIGDDVIYAIGDVPTEVAGMVNLAGLDKDTLCDNTLPRIGYMCYYAEFRDGDKPYRDYLPDATIKDMNGVSMSLKDRVPVDTSQQYEVGKNNPILFAIAAYNKHRKISKEENYPGVQNYQVNPSFTRKGMNENKIKYKMGLGTLLN
tara:strand:+ start:1253 stop:3775 length:2523 start_codon:yes stop_codon:yes gene_type:complete